MTMLSRKSSIRRIFSALAVTGCLLTGLSSVSLAQSNPGFTLWGGVPREDQLNYFLDFGGRADAWDRYRLRIPAKKMELGVAQFAISYPDYYKGKFNKDKIEVVVKGKSVPLQEVNWDKEGRIIQINLKEPVEAGNNVEIVFNDVRNPSIGGIFYFECRILTPGDVPLPRYLGTWVVSIS